MASRKRQASQRSIESPLGKSLTDFVTLGKARRALRKGSRMIGRAAGKARRAVGSIARGGGRSR